MIIFTQTQDKYVEDPEMVKIQAFEGQDIQQLLGTFKSFLLAIGHHPDNVERIYFLDSFEEIVEKEEGTDEIN